jgi:hypothetical protein
MTGLIVAVVFGLVVVIGMIVFACQESANNGHEIEGDVRNRRRE